MFSSSAFAWYQGRAKRLKITIQSSQVTTSDVSNFPVYVNLDDIDPAHGFWAAAQANGQDIIVTNSSDTRMSVELVSIDTGAYTGQLYFKADSASASVDTDFYIYYEGGGTETHPAVGAAYGRNDVWSNGYVAVYHFEETASTYTDSTGGNDATVNSITSRTGTGQIGYAPEFDGTDYLYTAHSAELNLGDYTIEGWIDPDDVDAWSTITCKGSSDNNLNWYTAFNNNQLYHGNTSYDDVVSGAIWTEVGDWQYFAVVIDEADAYYMYRNGAEINPYGTRDAIANSVTNTADLWIGSNDVWDEYIDGHIDELRFSNDAKPSTWVSTSYNNQNTSASFYSIAAEEDSFIVSGTVYQSDRSTNIGAAKTIEFALDSVSQGTVETTAGGAYTCYLPESAASTLTLWIDGETEDGTTVTLVDGTSDVSSLDAYQNHLTTRYETGSSITNADMANWDSSDDAEVLFTYSGGAVTVNDSVELYIPLTYTYQPGAALTVYDIEINGTLNGTSGNVTVSSDWDLNGTFTHGNNTVVFDDVGQSSTIAGATTFYNLTCATAAKQLDFTAGDVSIVSNALTLTGTAGNLIDINSTSAGSVFGLILNGTISADYVDVQDSTVDGTATLPVVPTNSTDNGNNTNWFVSSPAGWYSVTSRTGRVKISIESTEVASTQVDFPVYFDLSNIPDTYDFWDDTQADGGDIVITTADGTTRLPLEIVSIVTTPSSEAGELWFKAPAALTSSDTIYYLYYGHATEEQPAIDAAYGAEAVWSNNYLASWHLHDDFLDSSSNDSDGTNTGSADIAGKIGDGQDFEGVDYIDVATTAFSNITDEVTVSLWQYGDAAVQPQSDNCFHGADASNQRQLAAIIPWATGIAYWDAFGGSPYNRISKAASAAEYEGQWNRWSFTLNSTTGNMYMYLNGSQWHSDTGKTNTYSTITNFKIGSSYDTLYNYDGIIDEMRISTVARSVDWIETEHNNQNAPATFVNVISQTKIINISGAGYQSNRTNVLGAGQTIALAVNGTLYGTDDTNAGSGYSFTGVRVESGDTLTLWIDGETSDGTIVTTAGESNISSLHMYVDHLTLRHHTGSSITNANLANWDSSDDAEVLFTYSGGDITVPDNVKVYVPSSYTYQPGGSVALYEIEIDGTLNGTSGDFTVKEDWNLDGTFTHGNNTVTFTDSGQASRISGNVNFYNLTCTTASKQLDFIAGETFTISNALTLTGTSGNLIDIDSTSSGSLFYIMLNGTASADYVDVRDSLVDGTGTIPIGATNSVDTGNTFNWFTGLDWYSTTTRIGRIKFTVDADEVPSFQTDVPVYLDLSGISDTYAFWDAVQADGGDIIVTRENGTTRLSVEIVHITTTEGSEAGEIWFKAPALFAYADTTFYLYYGNATQEQPAIDAAYGAEDVWSNNYLGVWHFHDDFLDSTDNDSDGAGTGTDDVTGKIGDAENFLGVDYVDVTTTAFSGISDQVTVSFWQFGNAAIQPNADFCINGNDGSNEKQIGVHLPWSDGTIYWDAFGGASYNRISKAASTSEYEGQWNYWSFTENSTSGNMYMYLNGSEWSSGSGKTNTYSTITNFRIGGSAAGGSGYYGYMDEIHIATIVRSEDWIEIEHNNQNAPGTFCNIISEENLVTLSGTAYQSNRSTNLGSAKTIGLAIDGVLETTVETIADGVFSFPNLSLDSGDILTLWIDGETEDATTVTIAAGVDLTGINLYQNHLVLRHETGSNITNADLADWDSSDDAEVLFAYSGGAITVPDNVELYILSGHTYQPGGAVTLYDIEIDGTLNGTSGNITVSSNWDLDGVFTHGNNTVTFDDSGQTSTLSGTTTFYNLTCTTASKQLDFTASQTVTVSNVLTLTGTSGNLIDMNSTTPATQWNIVCNGTIVATYIDIQDSALSGTATTPVDPGDSVNSGNNTNWFTPVTDWFDGATREYRIKITVDSSLVDANVTNFPVFIDLDDIDPSHAFWSNVQANGGDIVITNSSNTRLSVEIVSINTGTNVGQLHFKADSLSSSVDTDFYIYYTGGGSETQPAVGASFGRNDVWSNNFAGVWHLEIANTVDATGNSLTGTATETTASSGTNIGASRYFDGTNDTIQIPAMNLNDDTVTISGWARVNGVPTDYDGLVFSRAGTTTAGVSVLSGYGLRYHWNDANYADDLGASLVNVTWTHFALAIEDTQAIMYLNSTAGTPDSTNNTAEAFDGVTYFGQDSNGGRFFTGDLDEIRISSEARTSGWVITEYNNQNDSSSFYSVGNQVSAITPVITDADDESFYDTETSVTLTGQNFLILQGTVGKVELADGSTYATATKVEQTVTSWGSSSIDITIDKGALVGDSLYFFATNSCGKVSVAYAVTVINLPDITNAGDESFYDGETGITITGTGFEASQGTGKVYLGDSSVYATATKVEQTVESWGDLSIDFTLVVGALPKGELYLYVVTDTGLATTAYTVTVSGWYSSSWTKRIKITVDSGEVDADLTNFPVYIDLDDIAPAHGFWSNVEANGADLLVTEADGETRLSLEVVSITVGSNIGQLHFKANNLDGDADTIFYLYYDNSGASQPAVDASYGSEDVWSNNYILVSHLEEDGNTTGGGYNDETSNDNDGTGTGLTIASDVDGQLGTGSTFDGTGDYITFGTTNSPTDTFTYSVWAKTAITHEIDTESTATTTGTSGQQYIWGPEHGGASNGGAGISMGSNGLSNYEHGSSYMPPTAVYSASIGTSWNYVTVVYTSKDPVIYNNGVSVRDGLTSPRTVVTAPYRLAYGVGYGDFNGECDEARISSGVRAGTWISTEYNNQSSPSTFCTIGSEEVPPSVNIDISGTVYDAVGGSNVGSGTTMHLAVSGTEHGSTASTDGSGVFTFSSVTVVPGDKVIIWIDSASAYDATTGVVIAGASATGCDLYDNTMSVIYKTGTVINTADLSEAKGVLAAAGIIYSVSGSDLTVTSGNSFYTGTGYSFTADGTADLDDFYVEGVFIAGGNINVEGNWNTISGTFTSGSYTVDFDGTSKQTIQTGGTGDGQDFQTLTHSGTGELELSNYDLEVDGTFTQSGSSDFDTSVQDLFFGGLTISSGTFNTDARAGSWDINGAVNISSGTFTATSGIMTVSGNFSNSSTFTHNSGTVVFDTTDTSVISGSSTFNAFTCSIGSKVLNFGTSSTTTINGTLTLNGQSSGTKIDINSVGGAGTAFNLALYGSHSVQYVDVQGSSAYGTVSFPIEPNRLNR